MKFDEQHDKCPQRAMRIVLSQLEWPTQRVTPKKCTTNKLKLLCFSSRKIDVHLENHRYFEAQFFAWIIKKLFSSETIFIFLETIKQLLKWSKFRIFLPLGRLFTIVETLSNMTAEENKVCDQKSFGKWRGK